MLSAIDLPAGNRVFPLERFMKFFEAIVTCILVFVAGIHHFYHGPVSFGHPQHTTAADAPG
jgi:hypothetical protein